MVMELYAFQMDNITEDNSSQTNQMEKGYSVT